jgi:hypothetical protein
MLIYTPLMLLKRIVNNTYGSSGFTIVLLRSIYYDKNENYIFIPKDFKPVIETYVLTEFVFNYDFFIKEIEANYTYILANKDFQRDENNKNMYTNKQGLTIVKVPNGKFYKLEYEYEEGKYDLGEEWILLQEK